MRKALAIFAMLLLLAAPAWSGEKTLTFQWEQAISADFAGWQLYMSETPGVYPSAPVATINYGGVEQTTYTSDEVIPSADGEEHTYYFVLTAFDTEGNESGRSNEVSQVIDFLAPDAPFSFTVTVQAQ